MRRNPFEGETIDLNQTLREIAKCRQEEDGRIRALYEKAFGVLERRGADGRMNPDISNSSWERVVVAEADGIAYSLSTWVREPGQKLEKFGFHGHKIDVKWRPIDDREWGILAVLSVGGPKRSLHGTEIMEEKFSERNLMTDFTPGLNLVERVLSEVFKA